MKQQNIKLNHCTMERLLLKCNGSVWTRISAVKTNVIQLRTINTGFKLDQLKMPKTPDQQLALGLSHTSNGAIIPSLIRQAQASSLVTVYKWITVPTRSPYEEHSQRPSACPGTGNAEAYSSFCVSPQQFLGQKQDPWSRFLAGHKFYDLLMNIFINNNLTYLTHLFNSKLGRVCD